MVINGEIANEGNDTRLLAGCAANNYKEKAVFSIAE